MHAIIAPEPGGPEALRLVELADPEPDGGELLVRVGATALNRADTLQRMGDYPPPPGASEVLGLELAGVVEQVAPDVERWRPGDQVCSVLAGGGYAELATLPAEVALPLPGGLDLVEAAAVPEVFFTAYDNLFTRGRLAAGERLLVHGGASGVGTAAIQLAVRAGATVFATASSQAKLDTCVALGASAAIHYEQEDFVERVDELTDGAGVDVILDMVGGPYLDRNLQALALDGRLVVIGLQGGASAELALGRLLTRRLTVTASTLRARTSAQKAALARAVERDVWPGFADGSLRPVIDRVLALDEAAEAHRVMEAGEHIGKIVLRVNAS